MINMSMKKFLKESLSDEFDRASCEKIDKIQWLFYGAGWKGLGAEKQKIENENDLNAVKIEKFMIADSLRSRSLGRIFQIF